MRRRLICLMLCLVALMTLAFSGCGEAEETGIENKEQQSARTPVSINMWVVCEKAVDPITEAAVEDAFNDLTQSMYTTKVDFIFLTEDEYFTALDDAFAQAEQYKIANSASTIVNVAAETTEAVETTVEMVTNELGQQLLKYPDITEGQIDIVFLAGEELLETYVSEGKLLALEEKLNSSDAKEIRNSIGASFLEQIRVNSGSTAQAYSVPNRYVAGDYTYMLVNKELLEDYYLHIDDINTFADCEKLITGIGESGSGIVPVLEKVAPVNMQYWLDFAANVGQDFDFVFTVGSATATVCGNDEDLIAAPYYTNTDTVMVPLRNFASELDATGYKEDTETHVATFTYGVRNVTVTPGSMTAVVDGENVRLSVAPVYDATAAVLYAPLDFVLDALCATCVPGEAADQYVIEKKEYDLSLLASYVGTDAKLGDRIEMTSAFAIPEFTDHMLLMQKCEENGWFAADPANTADFGVAILTGSKEEMMAYEAEGKYAVKVLANPVIDEEDIYDSMFAVTSYTVDVDRALEVLTLIYTNTEAMNILGHGVEGVHYEFDDNGQFSVISDDYAISDKIGNAFLSYTEDVVGNDVWTTAKEDNLPVSEVWGDEIATNRDARVYPFFGLDDTWSTIAKTELDKLQSISNVMFDRMEKCENSEELAAFFAEAQAEIDVCEAFQTAIGNVPEPDADSEATDGEESEEAVITPYVAYSEWGKAVWPKETAKNNSAEETTAVVETTAEAPEENVPVAE